MSPEHKAEAIIDKIFLSGSQWGKHDWKFAKTQVEQAIRDARAEAFTEAANTIYALAPTLGVDEIVAEGFAAHIQALAAKARASDA